MPSLDNEVKEYMTTIPIAIDITTSLQTAQKILQRYDIRHLPVTKTGKLCGLLYERDLMVVLKNRLANGTQETVKSLLTRIPMQVSPDASVRAVIVEMLRKKHDACLVSKRGKLMGIFTVSDALKLLLHDKDEGL